MIAGFERDGLLLRKRSQADARASGLQLTRKGRTAAGRLDDASRKQVLAMLARLPEPEQQALVEAMERIQAIFGQDRTSWLLRDPRPGDLGWIVHRQAVLYAEEYGWNAEYEALVAEIVARYVRELDPARERCWIAEKDNRWSGRSSSGTSSRAPLARPSSARREPRRRQRGSGSWLAASDAPEGRFESSSRSSCLCLSSSSVGMPP